MMDNVQLDLRNSQRRKNEFAESIDEYLYFNKHRRVGNFDDDNDKVVAGIQGGSLMLGTNFSFNWAIAFI